jgi:hypothetical protein
MAGPTFAPNLEAAFSNGTGTLSETETKIYQFWKLVDKGFKPWEIYPDYEDNERVIKPEDKADLFKLDQFATNAATDKKKKGDAFKELAKEKGLGLGGKDKIKEFLNRP